jgi:hypothetical protein
MTPWTLVTLLAVTAAVARLFVPARLRPAWTGVVPVVALATVVTRGIWLGLDLELLPLFVVALATSVGAARDARRGRRSAPAPIRSWRPRTP